MSDLSKLKIQRDAIPKARARLRLPSWVIALGVVALVAAGFVVRNMTAPLAIETATVATAYPSQSYTVLNATGYVVAQRKASVASKATGRLEWLGVREGSLVKEGEIIARLENRDVTATMEQAAANIKVAQANLEQGEAEFNEAERNLSRSRDLLAKNFVSQAAHDTAVSRYEKAKAAISGYRAAVAVAQANFRATQVGVEQTLIRAPFDGIVLTKNANIGDNITPFSAAADTKGAVVTIADMTTLEVEADVSEANLSQVKVDQPCEIQLDALPGVRFTGRLLRMVPTVDRTKATVMAKVRFDTLDTRVLPEMSAKVAFLSQEVAADERTSRIAVQPSAIVNRDGKNVVFVVKDGKVNQVAVEVGSKLGELMEIKSGLQPGDKVAIKPLDKLRDGAAITVLTK